MEEELTDEDSDRDDYIDLYAKRPVFNKITKKVSAEQPEAESALNQARIPLGEVDYLHDLRMELSVEFGSSKIKIKDLIAMKVGSICMLNKFLGEPVDVVIGKRFMGKGEIVIVNERYGIRLSEVIRNE